jgi:two-component system LytT family response regulator
LIRALIVDDEPLARKRVRMMLAPHSDVEVVAECSNGNEAAEIAKIEQPSMLFMDVEMPGVDGFEMLPLLPDSSAVAIIYITAHTEFALDAFEANAVDYLVKPFSQERFDRALQRARSFLGGSGAPARSGGDLQQERRRERFAVRTRGQIVFVKATSIDWIGAEGNYARLHTAEQSYLIRESLQSLEAALDPALFVRIHRSAIVNIERVRRLVPGSDGAFSIILSNDTTIPLGPTFRDRLENLLGQKL